MFNIIKLQADNKRLKEELAQKDITIQYLNACINKANKRYIYLLEVEGQISIHDILEN